MTANWFANFAIFAWPVAAVLLYMRLPFPIATVSNILGALLLLPSGVATKLEMIPAFDKVSIPNLCAVTGCLLFARRARSFSSRIGIVEVLILVYVSSPLITSSLNNDSVIIGDRVLPGVGLYDGFSAVLSQSIYFLPFFVGRKFLSLSSDTELILKALVVSALLYSIPMLIEVRMSPQLSNWIYGYSPSAFVHDVRYGGYRPVVFMINGLAASFFVATAFLAALAFWRAKISLKRLRPAVVSFYLGFIVVLCKSAGVLVYSAGIGGCIAITKPKIQMRIAAIIVSIGMLYPLLRSANLFPTQVFVELASSFDEQRAASLKYRFDQEQGLLAHANERPFFGWGRYGRSRVYSSAGADISTTDGLWIITLGQAGLIGFLAQFGLLAIPVFRAIACFRFVKSERERILIAALTAIVAVTFVEQIPNASISPWSWLVAGALLGRAELIHSSASQQPLKRRIMKSAGDESKRRAIPAPRSY
jgi:hypothetical protein